MEKVAVLVEVSFITRMVIDVDDKTDNDKLFNAVEENADVLKEKVLAKVYNNEICENITDIREDIEMPFANNSLV